MHRTRYIALAVAVIVALSVMPALAETSVYSWWTSTNRGDTNDFWLDFSTDSDVTTGKLANGHYENGLFFNGDGLASIEVEWAGNENVNTFGWFGGTISGTTYTPITTNLGPSWTGQQVSADLDGDSTSEAYNLYEIFSGTDDENSGTWYSPTGDLNWSWQNPPEFWGFYMKAKDGTYFYSRYGMNAAYGTGEEANGAHQFQAFNDPAGGTSDSTLESNEEGKQFVLAWEDQGPDTWGGNDHTTFDYGGNPGTNHIGDQAHPTEPDYQDMVLTFKRIHYLEDPNMTPEPATWVLLACTGIVGVLRRRRKD